MNNEYIFDLEGDGLKPTKIHVLSVGTEKGILDSTNDYDRMSKFFSNKESTIIGHNIIRFDIPVVERILGIKVQCKVVDTLILSWYLEFERKEHGLESWGETFGIEKPKIDDWHNLTYDHYKIRCQEDVKINTKLWLHLKEKLNKLYEGDYQRLIDYLNFKMTMARMKEEARWKLDVKRCEDGIEWLESLERAKVDMLSLVMPKVAKKQIKRRPKKPYKADGAYSAIGEKWFNLLVEMKLPEDTQEVEVISGYEEPNPGSHQQIKDWLYSLDWKPETFKYVRNKETNEVKQIPQINLQNGQGVCPSIKKLFQKEPNLELLDGLGVIRHRISILKGFLREVDEEGYVQAKIAGITNTMRFKHAVCVNMPGVDKPYGELIRGCLVADEGYELCGADMASLENRIGDHFIWRFDKPCVQKKLEVDYDPHLEMAEAAGLITSEDVKFYKEYKRNPTDSEDGKVRYKKIHEERKKGKTAVYASAYGASPLAIARQADIPEKEGKKLHEAYWNINWAMRAVPKTIKTKSEFGEMWLLNPISNLWYNLRNEKDIWNTLVQGTGDYCFTTWMKYVILKLKRLTATYHDECIIQVKKGYRKEVEQVLRWAIMMANKELKLNRELDIDVKFSENYAGVH